MLLRSPEQVTLNEIETLCLESADHYEAAAQQSEDERLAALFKQLAAERRELADELAAHIRALDDLPQSPDPDRETVGDLISGIRLFFSADPRAALLDERRSAEEKLAQAVQHALQQGLREPALSTLQRILSHSQLASQQLQAAD